MMSFLDTIRLRIATRMLIWGEKFGRADDLNRVHGCKSRILIFFHGDSLAHTIRPLVVARELSERGYEVLCAGRGIHSDLIRDEGFQVEDVESMPQSRMDQFVSRGDYAYYDWSWIDRCVRSERELMQEYRPDLVIHDMKPTVTLSAQLEGIDDARVTQAYNQPGYVKTIKLPDGFPTGVEPFQKYLEQHASEVKRQRSFCLLADIPEFHPSNREVMGYHYVGPLLDRPSSPEWLEVLDEGWDISLPLIYLTCGSSGKYPDYLDDIISSWGDIPYRLLITTAGRWQGKFANERIRVMDFLPGEWILNRAKAMVGVVGIGAIYQSLHYGVPIIGAPEHIDQEYHLNRVEALGVGVKIDRGRFNAENIIAALDYVWENHSKIKENCDRFTGLLDNWSGGKRVGDLIERHFKESRKYRVDRTYLVDAMQMKRYLVATTPGTVNKECVEAMLWEGLECGIPHLWREGKLFFDRLDSWNWLYDHEPKFFEADYLACEEKRRYFFSKKGDVIHSRKEWQSYRLDYRLRLYTDDFKSGQRVRIFLPYPIPRKGIQKNIRLLHTYPEELTQCHALNMGYFYGYLFTVCNGERYSDFGYRCELSVGEQAEAEDVKELSSRERSKFLQLDDELLKEPEVIQFRKRIGKRAGESVEDRARTIYTELMRGRHFRKTKDRSQNMKYSTVAILRNEGGHCIILARAFIALCRAEGIPAREASGALIGYPIGGGRFRRTSYRESIFGHTWAEIYLEKKGWMPVEFHGIAIGEQAMTEKNVSDENLRRKIYRNTVPYQDYYFGHVDNQRIICANSVKQTPDFIVEDTTFPVGHGKRWQRGEKVDFEATLEVECI